ncbi:MAG: type I restriction enzyme HsdR N-terminal domain-containing protein, partial [Thermodesulfobacteriota bacterium]|nr:type I restriction enzyme HsdR N-terminal domain-containing protein [Thermodesulfobacteriota bacterium]
MKTIPKNVEKRIKTGIKKYKNVLKKAKDRDVNESDTVTILTDLLADICGYDKYTEITREYAIRNTYCDLAVKIDDKPVFLIEVKAIGICLNANHLRQAIQYASTEGIEWVILTNGDHWQAHRVIFEKPVKTEVAFDFSLIETKNSSELLNTFFLLSKEGVKKSAIDVFHEETQLTNRYMIAATL